MRAKVFFLGTAFLFINSIASAQQPDLSRVPTRTVTLFSHSNVKMRAKSLFDPERGVRGKARSSTTQPMLADLPAPRMSSDLPNFGGDSPEFRMRPLPSDQSVDRRIPQPPNPQVYVRYGALFFRGDDQWLDIVTQPPDALGTIKDMGEISWSDFHEVPVLTFTPHPRGYPVPLSHGRGFFSNEVVRAAVGHVYVLRVKKQKQDFYVLLRVEAIDPKGECKLSWKRVPTVKK